MSSFIEFIIGGDGTAANKEREGAMGGSPLESAPDADEKLLAKLIIGTVLIGAVIVVANWGWPKVKAFLSYAVRFIPMYILMRVIERYFFTNLSRAVYFAVLNEYFGALKILYDTTCYFLPNVIC